MRWLPLALLVACGGEKTGPPDRSGRPADTAVETGDDTAPDTGEPEGLRFAVIGDYGLAGDPEAAVAALVLAWDPEFVLTTGDNNYYDGAAETIDANIGQYWSAFISPYTGKYGAGAETNRFFPSLGNHDWITDDAAPYFAYFELPGNERYYDFVAGDAHFFCVDSDPNEPDGNAAESIQATWLREGLAASKAPWQVVYFHHAPYSSGTHESVSGMQWPFHEWGADLVLSGHDHDYERLGRDGLLYVVTGTGGGELRPFGDLAETGTEAGLAMVYGAVFATLTAERIDLEFRSTDGGVFDQTSLVAGQVRGDTATLVPAGATWKYLDGGSDPGKGWTEVSFDDSAWAEGAAPLGYGEGDIATEVSYGDDATAKHVTTWFRAEFDLASTAALTSAALDLRRDDGAMVYLNGSLVMRSNMPEGEVGADTLASATVSGADESDWSSASVNPALFVAGANVVAVEVHQAAESSSDLAIDLRLEATLGAPLVSTGDTWRYLDSGEAPPSGWTAIDFDDGDWSEGPSPLGYGNGDEATTVGWGSDAADRHPTTWFRRTFEVADPSDLSVLVLDLVRDDGAVVYLNGREVLRQNLAAGTVSPGDWASFPQTDWWETTSNRTLLPADGLVAGTNAIAVEVHQSDAASPDLRFDLEVRGR